MKHSYYILIATLFLSLGTAHSAERLTPEDRSRLVAWAQQQAAIPLNRDGSDQTRRFGLDTHIASASALPLTLREALMNAIQQGLGSFTVTIEEIKYSCDVTRLTDGLAPKKNNFVPASQSRQRSSNSQNRPPQGFMPREMVQLGYLYGKIPGYPGDATAYAYQVIPGRMVQHGYPYGQIPGYATVDYSQGFMPGWMVQSMPGMNLGQPYSAAFNPYATSYYPQGLQQMPPPPNAIMLDDGSYIIPGGPAPKRPAHGNPGTMQANPSKQKAPAFVQSPIPTQTPLQPLSQQPKEEGQVSVQSPSRQTTVQPLPEQQAEQAQQAESKKNEDLTPSIVVALASPIPGELPSVSSERQPSPVKKNDSFGRQVKIFWKYVNERNFETALKMATKLNYKKGKTLCLHELGKSIPPEDVPSLQEALISKRNKIPLLEIVILYGPEEDRQEASQKLLSFDPKNTIALNAIEKALAPEEQPDYEEINQQEPPATQPAPKTAEQEAFERALQFVEKPNASLPEAEQLHLCRSVVSSRLSTDEQKEAAWALIDALMHRGIRPENPPKSPEPADSSEPEVDLSKEQTDNPKKKKKKRKKKKPNPAPRHLAQQEQQAAAATDLVTTFIF